MILDYPKSFLYLKVNTLKYRKYHNSKFMFKQWGYVSKIVIYLFKKLFILVVQRLWCMYVRLMRGFAHLQSCCAVGSIVVMTSSGIITSTMSPS